MEAPLTPPRVEERGPRRILAVHVSSSCTELGQDVGAHCSQCPTGACSSQLYSAKCLELLRVTGVTQVLLVVGCLSSSQG